MARRAEANTLALEEQAEEITTAGPASLSARATKAASEKVLCAPRVAKVRRQGAADRVALPVGELGLEDPGGAGAEEHADARGARSGAAARCTACREAVLGQAEPGEAVVAAVEGCRSAAAANAASTPGHLADVGLERRPSRRRRARVRCARHAGRRASLQAAPQAAGGGDRR